MRFIAIMGALCVGISLFGLSAASAAPANGTAIIGMERSNTVVQVRDGCGRFRHFSHRRGHCVWGP